MNQHTKEEAIKEIKEAIRAVDSRVSHLHTLAGQAAQDLALMLAPRYADPRCLTRYQGQVYSQNGEDGIIAEIFSRIGTTNKYFVELGVEQGFENNTRFLLQIGWTGVWVEGNTEHSSSISEHFSSELSSQTLRLVNAFMTKENVNQLFIDAEVPREFDFLSIDIDMNTHHIWQSLTEYKPRVVCIEYNASIPPSVDFSVPYVADAIWDGSNYFGAGLKSLETIGRDLGYKLVGCDFLGVNAFFVREDLCSDQFLEPYAAKHHYEPPRYIWAGHRGHHSKQL